MSITNQVKIQELQSRINEKQDQLEDLRSEIAYLRQCHPRDLKEQGLSLQLTCEQAEELYQSLRKDRQELEALEALEAKEEGRESACEQFEEYPTEAREKLTTFTESSLEPQLYAKEGELRALIAESRRLPVNFNSYNLATQVQVKALEEAKNSCRKEIKELQRAICELKAKEDGIDLEDLNKPSAPLPYANGEFPPKLIIITENCHYKPPQSFQEQEYAYNDLRRRHGY